MVGDVLGGLFGESAEPSQQVSGLTELLKLFPELQGVGEDIISRGIGLAGQTAPFTAAPAQIAGLSGLEQQGLAGIGGADFSGIRGLPPTGAFTPQFGFGQQANQAFRGAQGLFGGVAPALQQAGGLIQQGVAPITGGQIQEGISQFFNPFESQVVSNVAREAQAAGSTALSQLAGRASAAGGFGGTRQALLESQVPELITQQVGDVSARLRQAGFESAATRALQNLQAGRQRSLTGAGLGIQQAGQFAGAGAQLGGLGTQLFGARQGVQDIQSQQITDQLRLGQAQLGIGQAQLGAGGLPRGLEQAGFGREAFIAAQEAGVPLQQLQLLQGLISGFPSGGTATGGTAGTSGLFGSGGSFNLGGTISPQNIAFGF